MSDTIAAISTALAPAALGIIRISGPGAADAAERVFRPCDGTPLRDQPNRLLVRGVLLDRTGRVIDDILAFYARAPRTFTGEDVVELQCHGSQAVLAAGLDALFAAGVRQAGPGEFTKRAFLNGCMDLSQAEAVIDLIEAQTAQQAANAAGQVGGALRSRVQPLYDRLTEILSHFHAVLDYPDEDIEPFQLAQYRQTLTAARDDLLALAGSWSRGRVLKQGVRAVLLGRPNVGKSSLLNALAGFDRVIVTAVPGTTRDAVEHTVQLGGLPVRLLDTAGIRAAGDEIEAMGVSRSEAAAHDCDLALLVCDGSQPLTEEDRRAMAAAQAAPRVIAVLNKSDLPRQAEPLPMAVQVAVSAKTGDGLSQLAEAVSAQFPAGLPCDGSILTNARQSAAAERAADAVDAALSGLDAGFPPDAVLCDVEAALEALGEITGANLREEIVNRIFSRFCVGK